MTRDAPAPTWSDFSFCALAERQMGRRHRNCHLLGSERVLSAEWSGLLD